MWEADDLRAQGTLCPCQAWPWELPRQLAAAPEPPPWPGVRTRWPGKHLVQKKDQEELTSSHNKGSEVRALLTITTTFPKAA